MYFLSAQQDDFSWCDHHPDEVLRPQETRFLAAPGWGKDAKPLEMV